MYLSMTGPQVACLVGIRSGKFTLAELYDIGRACQARVNRSLYDKMYWFDTGRDHLVP